MTSINISFVTGISSVSGGGKTAVTQKLVELLKDALTLCFDAYDKTNIHPENLEAWLIEGGDYNAWETPVLTRDLQALTSGYHLTSPLDGSKVSPAEYVVFDAPLGRAHRDTGRFIDLMVFIDTPSMSLWPAGCYGTWLMLKRMLMKLSNELESNSLRT